MALWGAGPTGVMGVVAPFVLCLLIPHSSLAFFTPEANSLFPRLRSRGILHLSIPNSISSVAWRSLKCVSFCYASITHGHILCRKILQLWMLPAVRALRMVSIKDARVHSLSIFPPLG